MGKELDEWIRDYKPKGPDDERRLVDTLQRALAEMEGGPAGRLSSEYLLQVLARRRSMGLSRLKPDPVDRKLVEAMLQAANWAPSHGDTEPWRFFVFMGEGREALASIFEQALVESGQESEGGRKRAFASPVWIAIGMSPQLAEDGSLVMSEEEEVMAVACAVQNLHLMASELGLVGMWHSKGLSVNPIVGQKLGLQAPSRLLGFFMCGWPAVEVPSGERGDWSNKVTWFD